jgi:cysteine desulfurase
MRRVYLDYSATTPLDPEVLASMMPFLSAYQGNPSSIHSFGREARLALEEARDRIARVIGAGSDELVFTSGGTESDNHALKGVARAARRRGKNHVLVSAIEHHAVVHPAERLRSEGFEVELVPVDGNGMVDPERVRRMLRSSTALVSIMHANNEVGTIQPIQVIARAAKAVGALVHTDAVQSFGKIPVIVDALGVDLASLSAHKIYGPRGIGLLYVRRGTSIDPLLEGGAQERNRRAGTENVALAVGFAAAADLAASRLPSDAERYRKLRDYLLTKLRNSFEEIIVNGHPTLVLPTVLSISFDAGRGVVDGEALIMGLDLRGVAVTSGSACASGALEASHVLLAMGRDEKTARATVRFSFGRTTTTDELDYAVDALAEVVAGLRGERGGSAR